MENIYPKYLRNYQKEDIINQQKYDKWDEFVNDNKYKKYFIDNKENWYNKLQELKDFIDKKGRPKKNSKYKDEKKLAKWLSTQQINYTKKTYIMKEKYIYDKWTEFVNDDKYSKYFTKDDSKDDIKES